MERIDFETFLGLTGNGDLLAALDGMDGIGPLPTHVAMRLAHLVRIHMAIGSVPAVVHRWVDTHDFAQVDRALDEHIGYMILSSAHDLHLEETRCAGLWRNLPRQMARENARFRQGRPREETAGIFLEPLLLHLVESSHVHRIRRLDRPDEPAQSYEYQSQYKYYFADTGVFRRLAGLAAATVDEEKPDLSRFRGILTESYVLQHLRRFSPESIWYWKSGNQAEVDFIIRLGQQLIPVEVKTARNVKSRSLALYRRSYHPPIALRYSLLNLKLDDDLLNIPLYMIRRTGKLVSLLS